MQNNRQLKMTIRKLLSTSVLIGVCGANGVAVAADERESLETLKATTTNLIDLLIEEGVLSKDKAEAIKKKAAQDAAQQVKQMKSLEAKANETGETTEPAESSVRVQYVPEHVKKEMRDELKKEVMTELNYKAGERLAMPTWVDRFTFNGDLRLRFQQDNFGKDEEGNYTSLSSLNDVKRDLGIKNASEERRRFRTRARLGVDVKVNDWLTGGMRFTTGLLSTPVTPNQTGGIAQGKYEFGLDRAFLNAKPRDWLTVQAGRFANPMMSTDLLWDPDLAFDGVAATFTPKINDRLTSFTTIGAFPIEEVESSQENKAEDKWIYALQTGIKWQSANKSTARIALSYFDYKNVEGKKNPVGLNIYDATAPKWRQGGNNTFDINVNNLSSSILNVNKNTVIGLASKFKQINLTGEIDLLTYSPVHVTLTADYVKNIGFDAKEISRRTGSLRLAEETDGYQALVSVGHNSFSGPADVPVKRHDWRVGLGYKYVEADAVLDGYTDSNFHLGGSDAKGWLLTGEYGIDKNAWLGARYFSTDEISGFPSGFPLSIDVFLIDFIAKF